MQKRFPVSKSSAVLYGVGQRKNRKSLERDKYGFEDFREYLKELNSDTSFEEDSYIDQCSLSTIMPGDSNSARLHQQTIDMNDQPQDTTSISNGDCKEMDLKDATIAINDVPEEIKENQRSKSSVKSTESSTSIQTDNKLRKRLSYNSDNNQLKGKIATDRDSKELTGDTVENGRLKNASNTTTLGVGDTNQVNYVQENPDNRRLNDKVRNSLRYDDSQDNEMNEVENDPLGDEDELENDDSNGQEDDEGQGNDSDGQEDIGDEEQENDSDGQEGIDDEEQEDNGQEDDHDGNGQEVIDDRQEDNHYGNECEVEKRTSHKLSSTTVKQSDESTVLVVRKKRRKKISFPKKGRKPLQPVVNQSPPELVTVGKKTYHRLQVNEPDQVTPNVRRSKRKRVEPLEPGELIEYKHHWGVTPSHQIGAEMKYLLRPLPPSEKKAKPHTKKTKKRDENHFLVTHNADTGKDIRERIVTPLASIVPTNIQGESLQPEDDICYQKYISNESMACGYMTMKKYSKKPPVTTGNNSFTFHVVKGNVTLDINDQSFSISSKSYFTIPRNTVYSISNDKATTVDIMYIINKL